MTDAGLIELLTYMAFLIGGIALLILVWRKPNGTNKKGGNRNGL